MFDLLSSTCFFLLLSEIYFPVLLLTCCSRLQMCWPAGFLTVCFIRVSIFIVFTIGDYFTVKNVQYIWLIWIRRVNAYSFIRYLPNSSTNNLSGQSNLTFTGRDDEFVVFVEGYCVCMNEGETPELLLLFPLVEIISPWRDSLGVNLEKV